MSGPGTTDEASGRAAGLAPWLALALHVAVGVVPYAGSGLVAPAWGVALLWASWAGLLLVWFLLRRRAGWTLLAVPFGALVWWVVVVTLGDALAGWTA